MKLVVHEVEANGIFQTLKPSKNSNVEHIRPHLYKHGSPSGSLKLQVKDMSGQLVAESNDVPISSISDATYFHGYIRFDVNVHLRKDQSYQIGVVGSGGYSFSEAAYCGVCSDFDLRKYEPSFELESNLQAPLDLEIWIRK